MTPEKRLKNLSARLRKSLFKVERINSRYIKIHPHHVCIHTDDEGSWLIWKIDNPWQYRMNGSSDEIFLKMVMNKILPCPQIGTLYWFKDRFRYGGKPSPFRLQGVSEKLFVLKNERGRILRYSYQSFKRYLTTKPKYEISKPAA